MNLNIILAGVGGQGILSIASVIDQAALAGGLQFKQAEVHGMSQRGGGVQSHLRVADHVIYSDLIPDGMVDLVLSVEPLEVLRYAHELRPDGVVVTSSAPFVNIPDYPQLDTVLDRVAALPTAVLVDADGLAKVAGSARSANMVMVGAASAWLPFDDELLLRIIAEAWARKGDRFVRINQDAFRFGRAAAGFYVAGTQAGMSPAALVGLLRHLAPQDLDPATLPAWHAAWSAHPHLFPLTGRVRPKDHIPATERAAQHVLQTGVLADA